MRRRQAWAVASLGGLSALIVGALFPGSAPAATSARRAQDPVDPDTHAADDDSTGQFQSCSAYYGFGKSWAHVQVAVDDKVSTSITYPKGFRLVLSGDLDPNTPGIEHCAPEVLTQTDWNTTSFTSWNVSYAALPTALPPGSNIVIPGQYPTGTGPTGSPLQLRIVGNFDDKQVEQRTKNIPNFHDSTAYQAEYVAFLVKLLGQTAANDFLAPCSSSPTTAQQAAAAAVFNSMPAVFQTAFSTHGGGTPPFNCSRYNGLKRFHRDYFFPYAWGFDNPVTFELDPKPEQERTATPPMATPITPSAITFTG